MAKQHTLSVRISEMNLGLIQSNADQMGMDLSDYVRWMITHGFQELMNYRIIFEEKRMTPVAHTPKKD